MPAVSPAARRRPLNPCFMIHLARAYVPVRRPCPCCRRASGRLTDVTSPIRVTVWGENFHEQSERDRAGMAERYRSSMHGAIASGLTETLGGAVAVRTATQDQPEHGLTDDVLDSTDVLTWWGHATHACVEDAVVDRVQQRVL